jgi:hypothetical protein
VALGEVRVLHVPSKFQFADVMTKGLPVHYLRISGPVSASGFLTLRLREADRYIQQVYRYI